MSDRIIVEVATLRVEKDPVVLTCLGLGSCLGIILWEYRAKIGALAHAMLPHFEEGRNKKNPARYVDTAIYLMVDEIKKRGGKKTNIDAKIIGGASMFPNMKATIMDIGQRNIEAARNTLKKEGITVKNEVIGGNRGRTFSFDVRTGVIELRTTGREIKTIHWEERYVNN